MREVWAKACSCGMLLLLAGMPARAMTTGWSGQPAQAVTNLAQPRTSLAAPHRVDSTTAMQESLKRDVHAHPTEFVVFATETGAMQFVVEHRADAQREVDPRMVWCGVVGYWRGKTLVVLPLRPVVQ